MKIIPGLRKNRDIAVAIIFLAAIALIVWLVSWLSAPFAGGRGTEENPYQIANWRHLNNVRDYLDDCFILMNDLDSTTAGYEELAGPTANEGKGWQPIGTSNPNIGGLTSFNGTFEGQGHEIHNLFIDRPYNWHVGLFVSIWAESTITNVGIVNATVIGQRFVGCLAGSVRGTVSDCYASGKVTGKNYVGGLVGTNWYGDVFNSYFTGNVIGYGQVGGLVGENSRGTVNNSYSTGNVQGFRAVGGLVGWNYKGNVANSFWDTETSGKAASDGGTGKNTEEMQDISTFSGATWDIIAVADSETRNSFYMWNIVDDETYPFLSWQP